ncbi:hypothetical protein HHK36_017547 [Tetracentron sinense]|uniref:Uncharacterized protein n=1 Tax=Tetracentron sinense TaxID=13715 RepID=A0A834Z7E1_TETSI|nr:hypothetical protein HHK36_017547 [Tetracentron sinense]
MLPSPLPRDLHPNTAITIRNQDTFSWIAKFAPTSSVKSKPPVIFSVTASKTLLATLSIIRLAVIILDLPPPLKDHHPLSLPKGYLPPTLRILSKGSLLLPIPIIVSCGKEKMTEASDFPPEASQEEKPWKAYTAEDLKRTVFESTDSALRSARSLQDNSSTYLRALQDFVPQFKSQYKAYEDAFFKKFKDELMSARKHPAVAGGVAVTAGLLLMRGPRRFLFRHTLGRLQSEEAQFVKAEKNVKELSLSVDLMKKESKKLLERAALAEKDMKFGQTELMNAGSRIQQLAKSVYKIEAQAAGCFYGIPCETAEVRSGQKDNEDFRIRGSSLI